MPVQPSKDWPVLLVPVRLETRFVEIQDQNAGQNHWELWVRIYPDQLTIETHERVLKQEELVAGNAYREALASANGDEDKRAAWVKLAQRFGPLRAAWIVQAGENPTVETASRIRPPVVRLLPEKFLVCLYKENGRVYPDKGEGNRIPEELRVMRALERTPDSPIPDSPIEDTENSLFDDESRWMFDFEDALVKGMAVKFELKHNDDHIFKRVVAVGINGDLTAAQGANLVEQLIDNHHYTDGFSFLPYGTPTNNTQSVRSGHSESSENIDTSYDIEVLDAETREGGRSNAERLITALGLGAETSVFDHVAHAHDGNADAAVGLQEALWPVIGDYFVRFMLPEGFITQADRWRLWQHFYQFIRARGPLPAIRTGNLPYGVLPVTKLSGWQASHLDFLPLESGADASGERVKFDTELHAVLLRLHEKWLQMAIDPGTTPRIGESSDPNKELLRVLAMEPTAVSHNARPIVEERLIGWLLYHLRWPLFGPGTPYAGNPSFWIQRWLKIWRELKLPGAQLLEQLSGSASLANAPVLDLIAWREGEGLNFEIPFTADPNNTADIPAKYLRLLCDEGANVAPDASKTLLFDLLRLALLLEPGLAEEGDGHAITVQPAICRLATESVLEFFNLVSDPQQIVNRIGDDPGFGKASPLAYGVRPSLARRIIDYRNSLPGGRFESIDQIDRVRGVGTDTLHDILFSFERAGIPVDIDGLFRDFLDLCTHRLDAWLTSFATRRLDAMRKRQGEGIYVGAFGWVEDLKPADSQPVRDNEYIHAPSVAQAAAAAILRSAFQSHQGPQDSNLFRINLASERVRRGLRLLDGVRQGQTMGALLGYQFERRLHDRNRDAQIPRFREEFPLNIDKETEVADGESVEAIAARNVVDGLALARAYEKEKNNADFASVTEELNELLDSVDSVADLFLWESAFQSVQGNHERAGAALEAAAGVGPPPEIFGIPTPPSGTSLGHRVCVLLPGTATGGDGPRGQAEPRLDTWFGALIGDRADIACTVSYALDLNFFNEASTEALETLPGIGSERAGLIMADRDRQGKYRVLDDLARIDGIGTGTLDQIRNSIPAGPRYISLDDLAIGALDFLYLSATPPVGEQTELEQRIAIAAEQMDNVPTWAKIRIAFERRPKTFARSMAEALEFGRATLNLLGTSSFLRPEAILPPDRQEAPSLFARTDYDELRGRVVQAKNDLIDANGAGSQDLRSRLHNAGSPAEIRPLLMEASRYGIEGAIPNLGEVAALLESRRDDVVTKIEKRVQACEALLEQARSLGEPANNTASPNFAMAIPKLIEAMQALFGARFIVLPTFTVPNPQELQDALSHSDILGREGPQRVFLWLQQAAQTHPSLFRLEDVLLLGEAWSTLAVDASTPANAALDQIARSDQQALRVYQLPHDAKRRWLALSDEELRRGKSPVELAEIDNELKRSGRPRNVLSVVCCAAQNLAVQEPLVGLLVDQWSEIIPHDTVTTGISLQHNHPNAQAPQTLLLAVPERFEEGQGAWSVDDLLDIVNDTIDLMKIRTVDLDAFRDVGRILPGIFLPLDPDQPGWDRAAAMPTIEDWIDRLDPMACVNFSGLPDGRLDDDLVINGVRFSKTGYWPHNVKPLQFLDTDEEVLALLTNHLGAIQVDLGGEFERVEVTVGGSWLEYPGGVAMVDRTMAIKVEDANRNLVSPTTVVGPVRQAHVPSVPSGFKDMEFHKIILQDAPVRYLDIKMEGWFCMTRVCFKSPAA